MRVLLAGEGKTELGEWAKAPPFRQELGEKGVLVALLERLGVGDLTIVDGVLWSTIRKYRAGAHASAEERNGLALSARRARCDVLVFSRDRDGSTERQRDLEAGMARSSELFGDLRLVGGVAIENIESWILVLLGVQGEDMSSRNTKVELERRGVASLRDKVDAVASASLEEVPKGSLSAWLAAARAVLMRSEGE